MEIRVNGKQYNVASSSLYALLSELGHELGFKREPDIGNEPRLGRKPELGNVCKVDNELHRRESIVTILNGYQTADDLELAEGDEVVLLRKGDPPPKEAMEAMLCARHTPGVYEKAKAARVAVAGLGGLGSHIALALARTGVGHLHLVDFDVVEPSNLNRQQYRLCHLGMPKAEALCREIAEINPYVRIEAQVLRVTEANAAEIFARDDIICEAFDAPEAKAMLVSALLAQCPQKYVVASSGMAGYGGANAIRTRQTMKRLYICGDGETGARPGCGLMAPRVMVCAGHQANMALRIILNELEV